ncbi:MAG: metallophosphoesterase family protein [Candidatus Methanomethylicaceae archaeon]
MPPTLNILALSDIHGKESSLRSILESSLDSYRIDAISISGDITQFGSLHDLKRMLEIVGETGLPFFYVLGNCDPADLRRGVDSLGICVESRCHIFSSIKVLGAGGSTPTPFGTPFEIHEDELVKNLRMASSQCSGDIALWITHNPPLGGVVDLTKSGTHVGSRKLRDLLLSLSPSILQCGHIHEARGKEVIGRTIVFNPGPAMRGHYAVIAMEGGKVDVQLGTA